MSALRWLLNNGSFTGIKTPTCSRFAVANADSSSRSSAISRNRIFRRSAAGSTLDNFPVRRVSRFARPSDKTDNDAPGHQLHRQFQTPFDQLSAKKAHTGDIAAGPVQACNEAKSDGIAGGAEYDGNACRGRLGRNRGPAAAAGEQNRDLTIDQLHRHRRQLLFTACCPAVLDPDVLAVDK